MFKPSLIGVMAALILIAGCAGERGLGCGDAERYANSRSDAPLRVPDDLSLPDETDSLSVPSARGRNSTPSENGRCLETPPPFSDRSVPDATRR
jgi:uncharacterized lipoprotein